MMRRPPSSTRTDTLFPYTTLFRSVFQGSGANAVSKVSKARGLGILRDPEVRIFDGLRNLGKLPPDVRDFMHRPQLLHVTKANRRATVHRAVALDTIAVKTFDAKGKVTGERLFAGLFTSMAYSRSPSIIPLLRQKARRVGKECVSPCRSRL